MGEMEILFPGGKSFTATRRRRKEKESQGVKCHYTHGVPPLIHCLPRGIFVYDLGVFLFAIFIFSFFFDTSSLLLLSFAFYSLLFGFFWGFSFHLTVLGEGRLATEMLRGLRLYFIGGTDIG